MDIRRIGALKEGDAVIGNRTRIKVVKNKVAPPFRQASSTSATGRAFPGRETSSTSVRERIIEKSGAWYSTGQQIGQGRERTRRTLLEDEPLMAEVEARVRKALGLDAEEDGEEAEPQKA